MDMCSPGMPEIPVLWNVKVASRRYGDKFSCLYTISQPVMTGGR